MLDRKAARARCDAATGGRWRLQTCACGHGCFTRSAVKVGGYLAVECIAYNDAEFIAHAREDLPAALDLLDALEEEICGRIGDDAIQTALLLRCEAMLLEFAGGGLGIRTGKGELCIACQRTDGLSLHKESCELAALIEDLRR